MKQFFKFFQVSVFVFLFTGAAVQAQYCIPTYTTGCTFGDGLTLFQLGTINQAIACSGTPAYYHDYTALSTTLTIGTPYTITVQAGYGSTYVTMWIDYNHNNTFDVATEMIGQVICASAASNYSIALTVPVTALTGATRLRAMTEWIAYPGGPCGPQTYGNCDDFTVNIAGSATAPTATSLTATGVTTTGSTVNGTINANGSSTTVTFQYGLTVAYGTTVPGVPSPVTGSVVTPVTAVLSGLTPNTLYHYRVVGVNAGGTTNGSDLAFTTIAAPPAIGTSAASGITGITATLNGTINANNSSTTTSFDYGLTAAYGTNVPGVPLTVTGSTVTPVTAALTGLLPNTLYHFRVNGVNAAGTSNGADLTFTTLTIPPVATSTAASGINATIATMNGTVNANNLSTTVSFDWGLTVAYGNSATATPATVTGSANTNVSANLTGLIANTTYHYRVKAVNAAGTTTGLDMTFFTACNAAGAAGAITGPTQTCMGGTGYVYSIAPVINANSYIWTLPLGGTIASGSGTNSITVNFAPVSYSGNIFVYAIGCASNGSPSTALITINSPATPAIAGPASVCLNSSGNVYTTQSGMSNYIWSVTGGTITAGGTIASNTATVTWNAAGAKSISVNYNNALGCPALLPTTYNVTVNPLPAPTIAGPTPACTGITGNVYSTQTGMTNYTWTVSAGGQVTAGTNTSAITVLWNNPGAQTVSVNYTNPNGCTAAGPTVYPVTVNQGPLPTITGSNSLCVNSGYYSYTTQTGMSNYSWSLPAGGSITNGQGTSSIQVVWTTPGAWTVNVNYTNPAGCTAQSPVVFPVNVTDVPGNAGAITGTSSLCTGATGVAYSVAPITGAHAYVWTLPAGATISSGSFTNSITVDFAPNASSGNITVVGNNTCGDGSPSPNFPVTINPYPADAGAITGQAGVCAGTSGVMYSVAQIPNATGYSWTVPLGATIVGGNNTNSITVDFGMGASSGNVMVFGTNSCGNGNVSPGFAVMVYAIPPDPMITLMVDTFTSSALTGNQWYMDGVMIPGATGQTYMPTQTGHYTDIVTLNGCSSGPSNEIYFVMTGIQLSQATGISIYPVPNDGQFILEISSGKTQVFSISVINSIGMTIYKGNDMIVMGTVKKTIDLRPVPNGIYSILLINNENHIVKKIVINK